MLGVFITLLYTYTMPINYYSSKPTSLRCHLMAKRWMKVSRNRNLRQEICPHVAVKVWQRALEIMLGVFITLLYTYTMPINYYSSKPTSLRCHLMAKRCLKVSRNRNLRQEICPHVAVKVWQRALEIMLGVFITLLYTYTMPINYYSSKPTSLRCHLMAKRCLKVSRNRNLRQEICPHVAVKVWQRALEIMLGVFITLLYTYTMPINYYSSKPTSLRCHLMAKRWMKVTEIGIWGKKSAPMWL